MSVTHKMPPSTGLPRRILIVTDAWRPQVNGVVRTLEALARELTQMGHSVHFCTPENQTTLPLPTYPEIRLALFPRAEILRALEEFRPDAIHIATEGPMGLSARTLCWLAVLLAAAGMWLMSVPEGWPVAIAATLVTLTCCMSLWPFIGTWLHHHRDDEAYSEGNPS